MCRAYVLAGDWNRFLELQGELLVGIREIVCATGAQIAFQPSIYIADASPLPADERIFSTPGKGRQASDKN
jgi:hypothetical protein